MLRRIRTLDTALHARIERSMEQRDVHYPWWIPTTSCVGQLVCVVVALIQRDALGPLVTAGTRPLTVVMGMANAAGSNVAVRHGLRGPFGNYSTACSSSAMALGEAW